MRTIAGSAALLACFAAVALWVGLGSGGAESPKPSLARVAAQPLGATDANGIVVSGRARAANVRVQYAAGCRGVKLNGHGASAERFTITVRPNRKRCAKRAVRSGKARIAACIGNRCAHRLIRIPAFGPGTVPTPAAVPPPPPYPSACEEATAFRASAAEDLREAVARGENVCVVAPLGDVDLGDLGVVPILVSSEGEGSMSAVDLGQTSSLTISRARFRSATLRGSDAVALLGNTIGGTPSARVSDQLIFMPDTSNDVRIEGNELAWTIADDSGNTGYGCRCYGTLNRLRFVGNELHDLAADGFQGVGGSDVLIDRNEIGPVGANPDSSEHSDNIQITGNGPNLRITNNWIHHQGYYGGSAEDNAGSTYIHGGGTDSLLYENNLVEANLGRTEFCGLGTGGSSRSNVTIRRNTWVDGGQAYTGFPGFEWDCGSGSNNLIERNVAVDPDGGFAGSKAAATFQANLFGKPSLVTLDAQGNCTSGNCNPSGAEPIGYRKPDGVRW